MYKSPVDIFEEISTKITEETDNYIVAEIEKAIGVSVDKDELIKALNYDRNQYNQGYDDAYARFAPKRGEWKQITTIYATGKDGTTYTCNEFECSVCGKKVLHEGSKYCPECGARLG